MRYFRLRAHCALLVLLVVAGSALAQETYRRPPPAVLDVLNAPAPPAASLSPTREVMLLAQGVRYPPIEDVSQPMLRLAGLRIAPNTNGRHLAPYFISLTLKRVSDGAETRVVLPTNAKVGVPVWSADGRQFAFSNTTANRIELWVGETATGRTRRIEGAQLNAVYGEEIQWLPDNRTLIAQLVPAGRGRPPAPPAVPSGPTIQESSGRAGPVRTFQDLLTNPHDEALFEYYATSQLAFVDTTNGRVTPFGRPAIFQRAEPAPDGQHFLVVRVQRPFSYLFPVFAFPREVEIWNRAGQSAHRVASLPLADQVPIDGVPTGPRNYAWRPTEPATLAWVEAMDEGDPRREVPHRDRVLMLKAPFAGQPVELAKTQHRFAGLSWMERGGQIFLRDYDRNRRWIRTFLLNADAPQTEPRLVWDMSQQERYRDPGSPVMRTLPTGTRAIQQSGDWIFLAGPGATPEGERPFLTRFNLRTLQTEPIFRSEATNYETFVALLNDDGTQFITRRESLAEPPNFYVRSAQGTTARALTYFPDPAPQLRGIRKQLVTYTREDGVQLSFTLYLPPNYREGTRLPTVVWAYPLEFTDPSTAGQVTGSTQRFTNILGASHLFFLLQGYAVLDNATMPIVGDPETVNNTFVQQIVSSAKAAIDKAVEMGVTDRDRVGVGGHSYGAFMTANLLAHSDLFRAGIARSGAYNRTLTPFGFQSERRTLWEAGETYIRMSPFMYAHQINEPILLIHGEADNNSGTFPIQSERMYQAIRGNGGTVRLVMLPFESHGYSARQSIEHALYEMISWFDRHVKNAPPRTPAPAQAGRAQ